MAQARERVAVGYVVRPKGVRGEVRVVDTDRHVERCPAHLGKALPDTSKADHPYGLAL